jgi:transposase
MERLSLGPIPADTSKAMSHAISQKGAYLQVGDQLESALAGCELSEACTALGKPPSFIATLALVTLFQFGEAYTDRQAAEAARERVEWKFALHLPLSYPGFEPAWLCKLREYARNSVSGAALIQTLADCCQAAGLLQNPPYPSAIDILNSVCRLNRIVHLTEAMLLAVEALAAHGLGGRYKPALGLLYEKYAKNLRFVREIKDCEGTTRQAQRIGEEVYGLFSAEEVSEAAGLTELPEMIHLWTIWENQFELQVADRLPEQLIRWRPLDCQQCSLVIG